MFTPTPSKTTELEAVWARGPYYVVFKLLFSNRTCYSMLLMTYLLSTYNKIGIDEIFLLHF